MCAAVVTREPVAARPDERPTIGRIDDLYREPGTTIVTFVGAAGEEQVELPDTLAYVLRQAVHVLAQGEAVAVVPVQKELTTQQAADLLNVSRQYLVRLLDEGKIPFSRTGTHRRIAFSDLMDYKRVRDHKRRKGLAELTQMNQDLGLYR